MAEPFVATAYGPAVASFLALEGGGDRLAPLANEGCCLPDGPPRLTAALFSDSVHPDAAVAGLYVYFSCFEEAHSAAQEIATSEGSFWHAIVHRQEPDAGNSAYWFRQTGEHPVFAPLLDSARELQTAAAGAAPLGMSARWDPVRFIDYCEKARRSPGSPDELLARQVQRAEWQLLFHHCARRRP